MPWSFHLHSAFHFPSVCTFGPVAGGIPVLWTRAGNNRCLFSNALHVGCNLLGVHRRYGVGKMVWGIEAQAEGLSVGAVEGAGVVPADVYNVNAADFVAVGIDVVQLFPGEDAQKLQLAYNKAGFFQDLPPGGVFHLSLIHI